MKASTILATCFGIGYFPFASGTAMSAVATVLAIPLARWGGPSALLAGSLASFLLGIYVCGQHERITGRPDLPNEDPSECVIDELAGQWLACAFIAGFAGTHQSLFAFLLAFVCFRLFDITKLWPVSIAEDFPGGLGVMADDMVAGLMAGVLAVTAVYFLPPMHF